MTSSFDIDADDYEFDISIEESPDLKNRPEMPWTSKNDDLLNTWNDDILRSQQMHERAGYHYKYLRNIWGIPAIIVPGVLSPIAAVFYDTEWIKYVNAGGFILVAVFSGIDTFFEFSTRKEQHFNHAARFAELSTAIEGEVNKSKRFRMQADVFLTSIRLRYNNLKTTAPIIPYNIVKSFELNDKFSEVVDVNNI